MTKLNLYDSPNFVQFSKISGAKYAAFIPLIPNKADTLDLLPGKEHFKKAILEVKNKAMQLKYKVHFWCTPFLLPLSNKYFKVWPCDLKTIDVDPEGYVRLCDTLDFRLTNIKGKTFTEIKNEYLYHPLIRKITEERGKVCRRCSFVEKCHGGCWSRAFWKYGSFSQVDPLCFFYKPHTHNNHIRNNISMANVSLEIC